MATLSATVSESLRQQAAEVARQRGETVADLVRRAVSQYVSEYFEVAEDVRCAEEVEARIAAGQERLYTHEEVWAELDSLAAQGALLA